MKSESCQCSGDLYEEPLSRRTLSRGRRLPADAPRRGTCREDARSLRKCERFAGFVASGIPSGLF